MLLLGRHFTNLSIIILVLNSPLAMPHTTSYLLYNIVLLWITFYMIYKRCGSCSCKWYMITIIFEEQIKRLNWNRYQYRWNRCCGRTHHVGWSHNQNTCANATKFIFSWILCYFIMLIMLHSMCLDVVDTFKHHSSHQFFKILWRNRWR